MDMYCIVFSSRSTQLYFIAVVKIHAGVFSLMEIFMALHGIETVQYRATSPHDMICHVCGFSDAPVHQS